MRLSLVIFDPRVPLARARKSGILGAKTRDSVLLAAPADDRPAWGEVAERSVLKFGPLFEDLSAWETRIANAAADGAATLLVCEPGANLFCIMHWRGGKLLRQHVLNGDDYAANGTPLPVEGAILGNFKTEAGENGVHFLSESGEKYEAVSLGRALVNAIIEEELGELEDLAETSLGVFELSSEAGAVAELEAPTSASGGVQLLRTLVSKGQLDLAEGADLRRLDLGMEPFLNPARDSYEAAEALIDWLVEQPGVEEVYVQTNHLAKLLSRW